ncbi:unnamed protein product, partial [Meganyctiphanes norvegica]
MVITQKLKNPETCGRRSHTTVAPYSAFSTSELVGSQTPAHAAQYLAGLTGMIGAMSAGCVLGYSSPAGADLLMPVNYTDYGNDTQLYITEDENGWFGSTSNIGALLGGPLGGILLNSLGRKGTMIATLVPFLLGWILLMFASNFGMLVSGRIFTGLALGLTSLAVSTCIGEFASADIRGTLGTGFQLGVTFGIIYTYSLGAAIEWMWLALACAVLPIIYLGMIFMFVKESPVYLLSKGKSKEAEESLQYYRGKNYNIQNELEGIRQAVKQAQSNKIGFSDLKAPYILKPLGISLAIMVFQQLSGINAVLFNLVTIFDKAGSSMSPDVSSIIISVMQMLSTFAASLLMDRAGRKLLLIVSAAAMSLSLVALGVFFYILKQDEDNGTTNAANIGWLPLVSLIIFIVAFSIGFGPIPWLLMGELFSTDVKELAGSIATTVNWSSSFIVTLIFIPLQKSMGDHGVYWLFAGFCAAAFFFCLFLVPETKGKTLDEISAMFGAPTRKDSKDSKKDSGK